MLTLVVRLPGVPETHPTAAPDGGSRVYLGVKKNFIFYFFFFFKMINGNDSDIFAVIVGQYCSA